MLLAIDTATSWISLALHDGHALIDETTWQSANNHTLELAPAVQSMLARAGIGIDKLTALAVAMGPGSYSALRIGVAFAKGIAGVRSLPVIGVSTLDIVALAQPRWEGDLLPVVHAGRSRVTTARYVWNEHDSRWASAEEANNFEWVDLIAGVIARGTPTWITGEIDAAGAARIAAARIGGAPITLINAAGRLRRAGYLAQEAWDRLETAGANPVNLSETFSAAALVPIYVKTNL